jgi:hypothetical protein
MLVVFSLGCRPLLPWSLLHPHHFHLSLDSINEECLRSSFFLLCHPWLELLAHNPTIATPRENSIDIAAWL